MGVNHADDHQPQRSSPRSSEADERSMLAGARRGDRDAMAELLKAYERRVYTICHRMVGHPEDAADLTQDVLTRVLLNLNRYDGRAALSTWIIRIALNACLSHLRKHRKRRVGSLDDIGDQITSEQTGSVVAKIGTGGEPSIAQGVEQGEVRQALQAALGQIPDEARALLILRDVQGLDYERIANVLDSPIGTIKSRLFRARIALRRAMEGNGASAAATSSQPVERA